MSSLRGRWGEKRGGGRNEASRVGTSLYFKHEVNTAVVHVHSAVLRVHVLRCTRTYVRLSITRYTCWNSLFRKYFEKNDPANRPFSPVCKFHGWNLRSNGSIHPPRFNYELCNSVYVRHSRHENCDSTSIYTHVYTRGGLDQVEETLSSTQSVWGF